MNAIFPTLTSAFRFQLPHHQSSTSWLPPPAGVPPPARISLVVLRAYTNTNHARRPFCGPTCSHAPSEEVNKKKKKRESRRLVGSLAYASRCVMRIHGTLEWKGKFNVGRLLIMRVISYKLEENSWRYVIRWYAYHKTSSSRCFFYARVRASWWMQLMNFSFYTIEYL